MAEYNNTVQDDEITLKELIIKVQEFIKEALRYWWILVILAVLGALGMSLLESKKEATYSSSLTFMMEGKEKGGIGAMAGGLLSSFGIGGGENNLDKIIQLTKSRNNISKALLTKKEINGKNDFMANHIMRSENIYIFKDKEKIDTFFFVKNKYKKDDIIPNSALIKLHSYIVGSPDNSGILSIGYSEESGIINMNTTLKSEELAVEFPRILYKIVEKYYINKSTEQSKLTYNTIEAKYDSLTAAIAATEYQVARRSDTKRNQVLIVKDLDKERAKKDLQILYGQLPELTKNKEMAHFGLQNSTPVIQAIDKPIYPIKPEEPSLIKAIIIGGFIGGFLGLIFIVVRKIFRDVMAEDSTEATASA